MARYRTFWFYTCLYLIFVATSLRGLADFFGNGWPHRWLVATLLAAIATLLSVEPWLTRRGRGTAMLYLAIQTALIFALALQPPFVDYLVLLYVILSAQAMFLLPPRTGLYWIAVLTAVTAVALLYGQGWPDVVPFLLMYAAAYIFVGSYALVTIQAETARQESQTLLGELQAAHRQLQRYAEQVKALTVMEERQHLARELHDSVTHTLFSINMTAEAARILLTQNPAGLERPLTQLQTLAQSALTELRALISQLRPAAIGDVSLGVTLRRHLDTVQQRDGLMVDLQIEYDPVLVEHQVEHLMRVIQEALHNIVKHAQTRQASVVLQSVDGQLKVVICDQGVGFTPECVPINRQQFGLASMRERVAALDGCFIINSSPGAGTQITVTVPLQPALHQEEANT